MPISLERVKRFSCVFAIFIWCEPSFAIFDFLAAKAQDMAQAAAYADAATDLIREISSSDELKLKANEIATRTERLRSQAMDLNYLSASSADIIKGPNWSSRRLDDNIRNTTDYVRRIKHLVSEVAILGTQGAIALNSTETNLALNEVQRNQQAMILQNEDARLAVLESEVEEKKSWEDFFKNQKNIRDSGLRAE